MYSALPIPLQKSLSWFNAQTPVVVLPTIVPAADFAAGPFAQRDGQLAYRDLILAAYIAQIAVSAGDIWGFALPYPTLPGNPAGTFADTTPDVITPYGSPGTVVHVDNQSVPTDAVTADTGLYERDLIIYAWLQKIASQLTQSTLAPLAIPPAVLNEVWSLASGAASSRTVSQGYPLNVSLFKIPDQSLADRDNTLAAYVANIRYNLDRVWTVANRLLVQTVSPDADLAEPEIYQLVSDTATQRVWASWPLLPGTAGQLVYNKALRTVTWQDESVGPSTGGVPSAPSFTTPDGGIVQLQYQIPDAPDAEFYRQKSARIVVRPWRDSIIFRTTAPENYITSGGLWQPSSALITTPGIVQFSLPAVIPAGCLRVGLLIKPSRVLNIFGYQNTQGLSDGTAVTLYQAGSVSWQFAAPSGGVLVAFSIEDQYQATPAFQISVAYNGSVIYTGAWSYGQVPGTAVITPSVQLTATGTPSLLTITWAGNAGANLTINEVQVTTVLPDNSAVSYQISASIGTVVSPQTALSGVAERTDCVWLDVFNPASLTSPTLTVNWFGAAGIALYVQAYDVRWYDGATMIQNPQTYETHKRALLEQAGDTVSESWSQVALLNPEIRTVDPVYGFVWDTNANQRWINTILIAQPRLLQAFQVAGPGDLGRPALVPDGLYQAADGTVVASYASPNLAPNLRVCQPWMIDFGCLVAGPDFWPTITRACATQTGAVFVNADFTYTIFNPLSGGPSITNLTSVSSVVGLPAGDVFTAYSLFNNGPAGGYNSQSITVTAWLSNLAVGTSYTITLVSTVTSVPGGIVIPGTLLWVFVATSSTMSVSLPTIVSPLNTITAVTSATLA